jgi:hypothetical protein
MAQKKFIDLTEQTSFAVDDPLAIEDISAGETKKIQVQNLFAQLCNNAGSLRVAASGAGANIYRSSGTKYLEVYGDGTYCILKSTDNSVRFDPVGLNASGTYTNILNGDSDGATDLYYAGSKVLYTTTEGIYVQDNTASYLGSLHAKSAAMKLRCQILIGDLICRYFLFNSLSLLGIFILRLPADLQLNRLVRIFSQFAG